MALSRVKTWAAAEVLTAADLNAEFNNILSNAFTLISPLTGNLDLDGQEMILDADADTSLSADTDDRVDFKIGGSDILSFNSTGILDANKNEIIQLSTTASAVNDITIKNAATTANPTIQSSGEANTGLILADSNGNEVTILESVASAVNELTITNAATTNAPDISATGTDSNIDITATPKGSGEFYSTTASANEIIKQQVFS